MEKWNQSSEEFAKAKGWKLIKGYKINTEEHDFTEFEIFYFAKEDFKDFVEECEFWQHGDIEAVYEDVDYLIESQYEEYFDDNDELYDEPVNVA